MIGACYGINIPSLHSKWSPEWGTMGIMPMPFGQFPRLSELIIIPQLKRAAENFQPACVCIGLRTIVPLKVSTCLPVFDMIDWNKMAAIH